MRGFLILVSICFISVVYSQQTVVSGFVFDGTTNEPLPFVNIRFQNSKIGTITDTNGFYSLSTYYATDSILASFLGYQTVIKSVIKDTEQQLDFRISPGEVSLKAFTVVGNKKDKNPAHELLKKVISNKKINNKDKLQNYNYEIYNKIEFDMHKVDQKFRDKLIFRLWPYVFDYEAYDEDSINYLPIFLSEAVSDFHFQKSPKSEKEVIKATKISGAEDDVLSEFVGEMYQNINPYENKIEVFGKYFLSPLSDLGRVSYKYYLTDSIYIDSSWCFKLVFKPKSKSELTFKGEMWINDTTYALKRINARMNGYANINFVKDFSFSQNYKQVEKEVWMIDNEELTAYVKPPVNPIIPPRMALLAKKRTSYRNHEVNMKETSKYHSELDNVIVLDSVSKKDSVYWSNARHVELLKTESSVYDMIDTVKSSKAYQVLKKIGFTMFTGFYPYGNFEIGSIYSLYSFNSVEGRRFRFDLRTSNAFSQRLLLGGYVAYGMNDEKWKFGNNSMFFLSKKPRRFIGHEYRNDLEQLARGPTALRQDNILNSTLRRNPLFKLNGMELFNIHFFNEWFPGLSTRLDLQKKNLYELDAFSLDISDADSTPWSLNTSEIALLVRFALNEKFVSGQFERRSLGTKAPILELGYTLGIKDLFNSDFGYHKMTVSLSDRIKLNRIGVIEARFEYGKTFGTLPFPLLFLHPGNESYYYQENAFNLMNFFEFVSDQYFSCSYTHHFNGIFFNRIPFIRKARLREVAGFKGVIGTLSDNNLSQLPSGQLTNRLTDPYYELSIGVENILDFIRVDALWRMTYLDNENAVPFGIRGKFQFDF
jgi:hypothetical protein